MPYPEAPPWLKYTLRAALAVLYTNLAWMGVLTYFDDDPYLFIAGSFLIVGAIVAGIGGAAAQYTLEWPGTLACISALSFAMWIAQAGSDPIVLWTVLALILSLLVRFLYLERERGKARRIHDVGQRLSALEDGLSTGE